MTLLIPLAEYRDIARQYRGTPASFAIIGLIDEIERLRDVKKTAHMLLTWTHQYAIDTDEMPGRGWWHVSDLHPSVWGKMNSAEQDLYNALMKTSGEKDEGRNG